MICDLLLMELTGYGVRAAVAGIRPRSIRTTSCTGVYKRIHMRLYVQTVLNISFVRFCLHNAEKEIAKILKFRLNIRVF